MRMQSCSGLDARLSYVGFAPADETFCFREKVLKIAR